MVSTTLWGQVDLFKEKIATALNTVTLYPDSTFVRHSNISYPAGVLFTILEQTKLEHEDDAQNQKFHWYRVATRDGRQGWIFGDGIAILMEEQAIPETLQSFHKKKKSFNYGFENSVMWIANVQGRDNFHAQDYLNPIYNELYLVITNQHNKSVHIGVAGASARGEYQLDQIVFRDVTGDGITDVVVEKKHSTEKINEFIKSLEIYTFRAGNIDKVMDEPLNIKIPIGLNIPPMYKFIEVDDQTVRIEYLQFQSIKNKLPQIKQTAKINFNIITYTWNERTKKYESLYGETSITPRGQVKVGNSFLLKTPQPNAPAGIFIAPSATFQVLQQIDNQQQESYYLVKTTTGHKGYLPAEEVLIKDGVVGKQLLDFYQGKVLPKIDNHVEILRQEEKM